MITFTCRNNRIIVASWTGSLLKRRWNPLSHGAYSDTCAIAIDVLPCCRYRMSVEDIAEKGGRTMVAGYGNSVYQTLIVVMPGTSF
jgi:hypothetical protein